MRKSKKLDSRRIHKLLVATCTFALASTISIAAFADPLTSNNLPVPNSVVNATLTYNNGVTVQTALGGLVTNQAAAQAAADTGRSLNVNVGTTANRVADIGYNSFNIGDKKNVNFQFGGSGQIALNRVTLTGAEYASKIYGSMTQTGQCGTVFLVNPNGILFGANSSTSLGSLVASTLAVDENKLKTKREISFERDGDPAGIYLEGPGTITASKSVVLASNAIFNKDKNITAGKNIAFLTGDKVKLKVDADAAICYPEFGKEAGHEFVGASTAENCTVTLPNGNEVLLGSINSQAGKLTSPEFTVIAKLNKDLQTEYQDIVNIGSTMKVGSVYMYANNGGNEEDSLENDDNKATFGKLNIKTANIVSTGANCGNIEITTDGKITTGDIKTPGDVFLGTTNLAHNFGPDDELSDNMAQDYLLHDLIGDSIKTGNITAENLIAVGKSIEMKNIDVDGTAALLAAEDLSVYVNNTENDPFGICLDYTGGCIKVGNVDADNFIAIGSSIKTGKVDADNVVVAAIESLKLSLAYDLSEIELDIKGGTVNMSAIDADNVVLFGKTLTLGNVEADCLAALLAVDCLHAEAQIDPTLFNIDITPFMTGNINEDALMALASPDLALIPVIPPYLDAEISFTNGTISADLVEGGDILLLGSKITVDTVDADDFAVVLGIKSGEILVNAGDYIPYTIDLGLNITGGTINIANLSAPFAVELANSITNDSVDAGLFAAFAVKDACLEFTFAAPDCVPCSIPEIGQTFLSIPVNGNQLLDTQPYVALEFNATTGTININSLIADTALLVGKTVNVYDWNYVNNFIKVKTSGIDISFESDNNVEPII